MIHRMIRRRLARRQGQGMTEYIIIVGLVAILLIGAVLGFKEQVRVTIEGSTDKVDNLRGDIERAPGPGDEGDNPPDDRNGGGTRGTLSDGRSVTNDGFVVENDGSRTPYNEATHGPVN